MGRGRNPEPWAGQEWAMDSNGKWRLWHGTYSPSASSWWHSNPKAKAKAAFPSYNALTPQASVAAGAGSLPGQGADSGGLVTDMQAALNVARKAEIRVAKLHSAYEAAQEQWAAYDKAAKENYQKERRRFQKDLERIEKEALDAEAHQQRSRDMVLRIANGHPPEEPASRSAVGLDKHVEELFDAWAEEDGHDLDGVLRRAMHSQGAAPITPATGRSSAPMTPVLPGRPGTPLATADPYLGAPADAFSASPPRTLPVQSGPLHNAPPGLSPLTGQLPKHPGQRDKSLARVPTGEGPPRTSIKEATKAKAPPATGHVTLEEKLQERRAMRSALRPFGIGIVPGELLHNAPKEGETLPGWQGLAAMTLEDDDPDLCDSGQVPLTELE
eukprot:s5965_g2.t1